MLRVRPAQRPSLFELLDKKFLRPAEDTVQRKQIEVLAIFSSPVRPRDSRAEDSIPHLKLMRELMQLQRGVPEGQRVIRPAAKFPESLSIPLREHLPRILQFSGHASPDRPAAAAPNAGGGGERRGEPGASGGSGGGGAGGTGGIVGGTLLFELEDGTAQVPPPAELVKLLRHQPRLHSASSSTPAAPTRSRAGSCTSCRTCA
jgi:hypothetical protein